MIPCKSYVAPVLDGNPEGIGNLTAWGALVDPLSRQLQYFLSDTRDLDTRDDLTC